MDRKEHIKTLITYRCWYITPAVSTVDTPGLGNLHPYIADYDAQVCSSLAVVVVCERKVSLTSDLDYF